MFKVAGGEVGLFTTHNPPLMQLLYCIGCLSTIHLWPFLHWWNRARFEPVYLLFWQCWQNFRHFKYILYTNFTLFFAFKNRVDKEIFFKKNVFTWKVFVKYAKMIFLFWNSVKFDLPCKSYMSLKSRERFLSPLW